MNKAEKLRICIKLLCVEYEKARKKFNEINTTIEEDFTLTERKFNTLDKKRSFLQENLEALEFGILSLYDDMKYVYKGKLGVIC